MLPNVSTLGSFLMSVLFLSILLSPTARLMVTTAGRPSGIAATAKATDMVNISRMSDPIKRPDKNTRAQVITVITLSMPPSLASFSCKGVCSFLVSWMSFAIFPISAPIPILTTTALPLPFVMMVPENSIFFCSATSLSEGSFSWVFFTGRLSPVRIDSWTSSCTASIILASAGTLSPSLAIRISPGTTSAESISCSFASLMTNAFRPASFFNASIPFSALYS